MSYHTVCPSRECPAVASVVTVSLHMCTNNCFYLIAKTLYLKISLVPYFLPSWCRVSFLKWTYNCQKCLRRQLVKVCAHQSALKYISSLLTSSISSLNLSPVQNLKEALPMPRRMSNTYFKNYPSFNTPLPSLLPPLCDGLLCVQREAV
jgi:hypothetical protein